MSIPAPTMSACRLLLDEIDRSVYNAGVPLFAVFVDFKAAFDSGSRIQALEKLAKLGVPRRILVLIQAILQKNTIYIDDGVTVRPGIDQTTGFAQGDNLSPLLFSILISDLPSRITTRHPSVNMLLYADDLVIYSRSRFHLQQALVSLSSYSGEMGLYINKKKTEAMKFRRAGRMGLKDGLRLDGSPLEYVKVFTYLGVTLAPSGHCFSQHVKDRVRKAKIATSSIRSPQKLSLKTALQLFDLKVAPCAGYGIQLIWKYLTLDQFKTLEKIKPSYLTRVLALHMSTRNRLVYILTGASLFVCDLKRRFDLEETPAYVEFLEKQNEKLTDVDPEIFLSSALVNGNQKSANWKCRFVVTNFAVHGFHQEVCNVKGHHDPGSSCVCKLCGKPCPRYHARHCSKVASLSSLAKIGVELL